MPAKEFSGKQIGTFGLIGPGWFSVIQLHLRFLPGFPVDDCRQGIFRFEIPINISADILFVFEDLREGAAAEGCVFDGLVSASIEGTADRSDGLPGDKTLKGLPDQRRSLLVDLIFFVDNFISQRDGAADILAFHGGFPHAPVDLLRKLGGIEFRHALQDGFQDDAFGIIGNVFGGGDELHTVFLEAEFISGHVITGAGKAVQLIDDHGVEIMLFGFPDHAEEFGALGDVLAGRGGTVRIYLGDLDIVTLAEFGTDTDLSFDALLRLAGAGIANIETGGFDFFVHK